MAATASSPGPAVSPQHVPQSLEERAIRQIEWYLGRQNLVKDYYLKGKMDDDFWVSLDIILEFPKMQVIGLRDPAVVADLLARGSQSIEVDLAANRIRPAWAKRSILSVSGIPRTATLSTIRDLFAKNPGNPEPVSVTPVPDRDGVWHAVYDSPDDARVALDSLKDATFGNPPVKISADIFPALDQTQAYPPDFSMGAGMQGVVPPLGAPHVIPGGFYPPTGPGNNGGMPMHGTYHGGVMSSPLGGVAISGPTGTQGGSGYGFAPNATYGPAANGYAPTSPGFAGGAQSYDPNGQFYGSPYSPQAHFEGSGHQAGVQNGGTSSNGPGAAHMAKAAAAAAAAAIAGTRAGNVNAGGYSHTGNGGLHAPPVVGAPMNTLRYGVGAGGVQGVQNGDGHPPNGPRVRHNRNSNRHSYHGNSGNPVIPGQSNGRYQGHNGADVHGVPRGHAYHHTPRTFSGPVGHGEFGNPAIGAKAHGGYAPGGRKTYPANGYQNGGSGYVDGYSGRGPRYGGTVGDVIGRPHVGSKKNKKRTNANRHGGSNAAPQSHGSGSDGRSGQDSDGARDDARRGGYDDSRKSNSEERRGVKSEPNLTTMHFPPLPGAANDTPRMKISGEDTPSMEGKESSVGATHDSSTVPVAKTAADVVSSGLVKISNDVTVPRSSLKSPQSPASSAALEEKEVRAEQAARDHGGSTAESEQDVPLNVDDASENDASMGGNPSIEKLACVSDVSSNVSSSSGCAPNGVTTNGSHTSNGHATSEEKAPDVGSTASAGTSLSYAAILRAKVKKPVVTPSPPPSTGEGLGNISSSVASAKGQTAEVKQLSSDEQQANASGSVTGSNSPKLDTARTADVDKDGKKTDSVDGPRTSSSGSYSASSVIPESRTVWANKPQSVLQATAVGRSVTSKTAASTPSPTNLQNPVVANETVAASIQGPGANASIQRVSPATAGALSSTTASDDGCDPKKAGCRSDTSLANGAQGTVTDGLGKGTGEHGKRVTAEKSVSGAKGAWSQAPRVWPKDVGHADKVGAKKGAPPASA